MALFGQDAPDPRIAALGGVLGDIITGGPQARGKLAFVDQLKRNGDAADAMWGARNTRAQAVAREGITGAAIRELMTGGAGQFDTMAAVLGSGATPNLGSLGDFQMPGYQNMVANRAAALESGDWGRANAMTSALAGKTFEPVAVTAQGIAYDPNVPLGEQVFRTTPIADAEIYDKSRRTDAYSLGQQASAASNMGAAASHLARAGLYDKQASVGGFNPSTGSGRGKAKGLNIVADAEKLTGLIPGLTITSAYRDPARNAAVGGMPNSQHPRGTAFDAVAPTPEAYEQAIAWGRMMGYEVVDERNRKGYKPHIHFEIPNGGLASTRFVPGGANPTKAGVQPNTDTGVGAPTVLGGKTPEPRVPASPKRSANIPAAAVRALWANPALLDEFAAKYGAVAAREVMARRE